MYQLKLYTLKKVFRLSKIFKYLNHSIKNYKDRSDREIYVKLTLVEYNYSYIIFIVGQ